MRLLFAWNLNCGVEETLKRKINTLNIIKPILFCLVFVLAFELISPLFKLQDYRCKQTLGGFYNEEPGSLDAVFVGASSTYAAYQPPIIYNEFGYTSYTLALPHMPKALIRPFIEEARKTQPDALYVVALNTFSDRTMNHDHFHHSLDYMKFSRTKLDMINILKETYGQTEDERIGLLLPFYTFHSAWDELETENYNYELVDYKNGQTFDTFLNTAQNQFDNYVYTTDALPVDSEDKPILDDLMSYCKDNDVNIVFTVLPQALKEDQQIAVFNGATEYLRSNGFKVYDLMADFDKTGIDLSWDYYNYKHTNLHGSLKVMRYLCGKIKDDFGLPDKHSEAVEADWNQAYKDYKKDYLSFRLAPFEFENAPRDLALTAPKLVSLIPKEDGYTFDWNPVEGADGYVVYRKYNGGKGWKLVADTTEDFLDDHIENLDHSKYYFYTAVAYRVEDGEYIYGKFNHNGLQCKATVDDPDEAEDIVEEDPDAPDDESSEDGSEE